MPASMRAGLGRPLPFELRVQANGSSVNLEGAMIHEPDPPPPVFADADRLALA